MSPDEFVPLFIVILLALLFVWGAVSVRRQKAIAAALARHVAEKPPLLVVNTPSMRWQTAQPGQRESSPKRAVLLITPTCFSILKRTPDMPEALSFTPDQLRWFGRPQKYSSGNNEIWLHVEQAGGWHILKIRLYRETMLQLVRALKAFASPELVEAYRRRRPYVHVGPVEAQPAAQDIHGAWSLDKPINLYLMPRFLVILQGQTVLRKIPLEAVQQIGALRRLDAPGERGLVRFRAEEETFAFAVDNHETFAAALAEAAKRTLEAPLERKQKPRDDDPEYEDWQAASETPLKRLQL